MTLLQLRYFKTLASILHYTNAAKKLHISQPSLSYAIGELEKELDVALFEKKEGKVTLSPCGEAFLPHVDRIFQTLEDGIREVKSLATLRGGTVHLGYFYSLSCELIPSLIDDFYKQQTYHRIDFKFVQDVNDALVNGLKTGQLDLAFCAKTNNTMNSLPLFKQELLLMVPVDHPFADRPDMDLAELIGEPLIMLYKGTELRQLVEHIFEQYGHTPQVAFEVAECNAAMHFVALKRGITIVPRVPSMDSTRVRALPLRQPEFQRTIYVLWNDTALSHAARTVLEYIRSHKKSS